MTLWSFDLATSRDKLKPLYLHYRSVCDHQTCLDGDIHWQAPNHKVIQNFDHATNKNLYYKSAYGSQTWQNDDFPSWDPTYNVTRPFDHMALWDRRFTFKMKFSSQTLSCHRLLVFFPLFFSVVFLNGRARVTFKFFSDCCFKHVWPG